MCIGPEALEMASLPAARRMVGITLSKEDLRSALQRLQQLLDSPAEPVPNASKSFPEGPTTDPTPSEVRGLPENGFWLFRPALPARAAGLQALGYAATE
jgi:hypothetical protein